MYVADADNLRIQKFDSNGVYIASFGGPGERGFGSVQGVAVDGSGKVYVVDNGNHRICKFDSNGVYITEWGGYGSEDGKFNWPCGVGVDSSGNVYVADSTNCRIQKFSSDGVFETVFYTAELRYCYGVAVDSSGNVYASNGGGDRPIWKFALSSAEVTPTPSVPELQISIVLSAIIIATLLAVTTFGGKKPTRIVMS